MNYKGLLGIINVIKKQKILFFCLTFAFFALQISAIFLIFWIRMGFQPVAVGTDIFFSTRFMRFMFLSPNAILYASVRDKAVMIDLTRTIWMSLLSFASAFYVVIVIRHRRVAARTCSVVRPGIVGVASGSFGSIVSTFISVFSGCCGAPMTILALPLVGGILVSTLGTVISATSFVVILFASTFLARNLINDAC